MPRLARPTRGRNRCARLNLHRLERRDVPATLFWDGGGGGDMQWTNPLNWSGDSLPGVNDDVFLAPGPYPVHYNGGALTVQSLILSGGLTLHQGGLTVTGTLNVGLGSTLT